ncbi:MAG: hypothetical protein KAG10_02445 [Methylococcales bacterium]|nr:hypothetical protein [Methylococcales bacterium]MCK5924731.1 hypothetical protein [Methylococcales bacterium]
MINVVAIRIRLVITSCTSKTLVNIFQILYVLVGLGIVTKIDKASLQLFYICVMVLFALLVWRIIFTRWLPKLCGVCQEPLGNIQYGQCPECKNYNTYDTKLWSKLEYTDIEAVHRAENNWLLQNILALLIVLLVFITPLFYLFFVGDHNIHVLNQKRRAAFYEIRSSFLRYSIAHGKPPTQLKQLLPTYVSKIPKALKTPKKDGKGTFVIKYQLKNEQPIFTFHVSHFPISKIHYNIALDRYKYESSFVEFLWETSLVFQGESSSESK